MSAANQFISAELGFTCLGCDQHSRTLGGLAGGNLAPISVAMAICRPCWARMASEPGLQTTFELRGHAKLENGYFETLAALLFAPVAIFKKAYYEVRWSDTETPRADLARALGITIHAVDAAFQEADRGLK